MYKRFLPFVFFIVCISPVFSFEYCWDKVRTCDNLYIAVLSDTAYQRYDEIEKVLFNFGNILAVKDLYLSHLGPTNLIYAMYYDLCDVKHSWVAKPHRVQKHVSYRFKQGIPTRFIALSFKDLKTAIEAKVYIRKKLFMDTLDIHITDSQREAFYLGDLVFSKGAEFFLNNTIRKCLISKFSLNQPMIKFSRSSLSLFQKDDAYSTEFPICIPYGNVIFYIDGISSGI